MLQPGMLEAAFQTYWKDMDRCCQAKAYWSLLHVTVCLPDICAALQSPDGKTDGKNRQLYISWCDTNLPNPDLLALQRWSFDALLQLTSG